MPIYEYKCAKCDYEFEKIQKVGSTSPPCPKCGYGTYQILSSGYFNLKGKGFYKRGMS